MAELIFDFGNSLCFVIEQIRSTMPAPGRHVRHCICRRMANQRRRAFVPKQRTHGRILHGRLKDGVRLVVGIRRELDIEMKANAGPSSRKSATTFSMTLIWCGYGRRLSSAFCGMSCSTSPAIRCDTRLTCAMRGNASRSKVAALQRNRKPLAVHGAGGAGAKHESNVSSMRISRTLNDAGIQSDISRQAWSKPVITGSPVTLTPTTSASSSRA